MPQMVAKELKHPPTNTATGRTVWKQVWAHIPSNEKDDLALTREEQSPRWASIVRTLENRYGSIEGLNTVELGSGRGDFSVLLARCGARVTLIDYSETALELARQRFSRLNLPGSFIQADILNDLQTHEQKFDVSLSSGVIEHFKGADRLHTVGAHCITIRPGGTAIISVPHARCLPYRLWKAYLELRGWWPYGMEIPYSINELSQLAAQSELVEIETECMGFWQSVGDHWGKSILGSGPDWSNKPSRLDKWMGATLLLKGKRREN